MSRLYDIVTSLSGQGNILVIPRPYLTFFSTDQQAHQLAIVLNQLVFWSGHATLDDGWFYKSHDELANEVALSIDQVRRIVDKLTKTFLPDAIETENKRVNGNKTKHYRIDGIKLVEKIFHAPKQEGVVNIPSAEVQNRNGESAEPERRKCGTGTANPPNESGESATPILYTDQYTVIDKQIIKTSSSENSVEFTADDFEENSLDKFSDETTLAANGISTPAGKYHGTAEDLEVAQWIYQKTLEINPTLKTPNWDKWANEIRLMRERDERPHHDICKVFSWANNDRFWQSNILCPATLRRQWDKLTTQMLARPQEQNRQQVTCIDKPMNYIPEGFK